MNSHEPEANQPSNNAMTEKSRTLFARASAQLDPATSNRLGVMRREALAGARPRTPHRWLPLGAAAATLLGIGIGWWLPQRNAAVAPNEISINASDQDLLPEDDAEIYDWLGEAPVAVNDDQAGSQ
jgi:hypothetical protein